MNTNETGRRKFLRETDEDREEAEYRAMVQEYRQDEEADRLADLREAEELTTTEDTELTE